MVIAGNMQLFPDHLTGVTPLALPPKLGRTNMVSI